MSGLRRGDTLECGDWFTNEREETAARHAVRKGLERAAALHDALLGPPRWSTLKVGDDRVPVPPPNVGPNPSLLVGEADVLAVGISPPVRSFTDELSPGELDQMRRATRAAHARAKPDDPPLTDAECDEVINREGPRSMERHVKRIVDSGGLN